MIIFSDTISLDKGIENDWLDWMKNTHIPKILETKLFNSFKILKLLDPIVDEQMVTYSIQYQCESIGTYREYQRKFANELNEAQHTRYGNRFVSFQTLLELV